MTITRRLYLLTLLFTSLGHPCLGATTGQTFIVQAIDVGDVHWRAPVATSGDLPADDDGSARIVLTGVDAGIFCRLAGAWEACGGGGASSNSFETMNAPAGTNPVADSATDILTWLAGGPITITGDATADSMTVACPTCSTGAHTVNTDDQNASEVPFTPVGGVAATDVQAAIQEVDAEHTVDTDTTCLDAGVDCLFAGSASEGGPATTSLALNADPSPCPAGQRVTDIAADGTLTCAAQSTLTRIVTVDQGGQGDYTTVAAACDFVATQTRSLTLQWTIQIGPGQYLTEPNFTVPTFTHLQGIADVAADDVQVSGAPLIADNDTSGVFITMSNGSSLSNLTVGASGTLTGSKTMVRATAIGVRLNNVTFLIVSSSATHPLIGFESTTDSTTLTGVVFQQSGSGVANTTHALASGTGNISIRYSWFMDTGHPVPYAVRNTGSGHVIVFFTRIGVYTGSTYVTQLANDGAGTMYALATPYSTSSGTIQHPWQWREEDIVSTIARDSELHAEDHATRHSLGGADPVTATNLASACTDVQVLGGTAAGTGVECQADQTGTDDQTASEVPITDTGAFFTGTEVETALQEVGPTMTDARQPADDSVDAAALADGDLGQVSVAGGVVTVEGLQFGTAFPGTPATGDVFAVTDDSAVGACDSAAGAALSLCRWSGAAWVALGDGGGVPPAFSDITSGTNTTAAMVVSTGASLKVAGTGTIDASGVDADGDGTRELSVTPGTSIAFNPLDTTASGAWTVNGLGVGSVSPGSRLHVSNGASGQVCDAAGTLCVENNTDAVISLLTARSTGQHWTLRAGQGSGTSPEQRMFRFYDNTSAKDRINILPAGQLRLRNGDVSFRPDGTTETMLVQAAAIFSKVPSINSPSTATCADDLTGAPGAVVITPTTSLVHLTNSDANSCDVLLSETGAVSGQSLEIILVSNAGGTANFADSAGVQETGTGCSLNIWGAIKFRYSVDRWVKTGCEDTN